MTHQCRFNEQGHCVSDLNCYKTDPSKFEKIDRKDWDYPYCKACDPHCVLLCDCTPPLPVDLKATVEIGLAILGLLAWGLLR